MMELYSLTINDMEFNAVCVMELVVEEMAREGVITPGQADEWIASHTVIIRKPRWINKFFKKGDAPKRTIAKVKAT